MNRFLPALLLVLFSLPGILSEKESLPAVTHYSLTIRLALKEHRVRVAATLSVKNVTSEPHTKLPFVLYRLLTASQAIDQHGQPLPFEQNVVEFLDEPSLQVRQVVVHLPTPLQPNDSTRITLTYDGAIFGYPEVMAYVKDRIDETYSLLRPDAFAFPVLAHLTFNSVFAASDVKFTYETVATVPDSYVVACGGELFDSHITADSSTFRFHSKVPTWRIDLAVAKFAMLSNRADKLVVYHLPEDSAGARRVLDASAAVIKFYSGTFGRPKNFQGYTIIEIPDGWGSQASDCYFLQTAAAFKDSTRIGEVYHEIGHSWNATPAKEIQRCRWFDEAFASFFEALAIRAFSGEQAFDQDMEKSRDVFVRWANHDRQVFETPIAEYGNRELGRHSYTKGAWSLYVLHGWWEKGLFPPSFKPC
ncbi:MAG TPA: hypothetical protein VGA99_09745 [bacterium]